VPPSDLALRARSSSGTPHGQDGGGAVLRERPQKVWDHGASKPPLLMIAPVMGMYENKNPK